MFSVVKPMYRSIRLNGQIYRKAKKVEEVLDMSELSMSIFDHDVDKEFGGETVVYQRDPSGRCSLRCDSAMEMKALQWYVICYAEDPRYRPSSPCMSFPWVVWDVLCSFKRNKMLSQNALTSSTHPLADRFSAEIEKHVTKRISEYELFCVEMCEEYEFVRRYNIAYGPRLMYILFVLKRWLGALAFRTYHHIAVTGRFDSIYIGEIIQDLSESESRGVWSNFENVRVRHLTVHEFFLN
ncbi:hypothetical protein TELCIR_03782 [Teladorsagia circumcincta]|uniref:RDRP C-terminal head domain-containing protein n=1 Tax=Teladorsagia circumcincta TaxID=45464 RepID=A0A2G9UVC5_TELCI|nr:hypothetical protein TELCIR_03782 [Teladorsagia circumcincta]